MADTANKRFDPNGETEDPALSVTYNEPPEGVSPTSGDAAPAKTGALTNDPDTSRQPGVYGKRTAMVQVSPYGWREVGD
jgi:hypothetical protein